jgi:hypothetical protein
MESGEYQRWRLAVALGIDEQLFMNGNETNTLPYRVFTIVRDSFARISAEADYGE